MKNIFRSALLVAGFLFLIPFTASAQHQGTLNFNASTTPGIAGYNAYRAPCTGTITAGVCSIVPPANAYSKLNATPFQASYVDTTVLAGQRYTWRVTAVCPAVAAGCGNGIVGESDPSNLASATVPTDQPNAPTNLTIINVQ